MQKRTKFLLGAIVAVFLALTSVPLAFAAGGEGGNGNGDVRFLQLTTRTLQEANVDAPPDGDSVGDRFVFSDTVFREGKEVGTDGGECVLVQFKPGSDHEAPEAVIGQCFATVSLPEGQITAQGLIDFASDGPATLAVTGGTGEFHNARGEVEVKDESATESRLLFHLFLNHH